MLTREEIVQLLDYNPETGVFTWKKTRRGLARGSVAGSVIWSGHRRITIGKKQYFAHKLAWLWVHGEIPECDLDHANRCRDDNRIVNLRKATRSENLANTWRSTNTSGYKGASKIAGTDKWLATIKVMGKSRYLGRFSSPQKAHEAYMDAARKAFGEFACAC